MMKSSYAHKLAERPRYSRKFWAVLITFLCSLGFLLFQGGKLAFMLFIIISILSVYLLLGQWSGIRRTQGNRTLSNVDYGSTVEAGTSLTVSLQLQIPGFWPMPYIFVKDRLYHKTGRELTFEATLVPDWRRRAHWEYKTPSMRRGHYYFGRTECVTEDIFGLFEHSGTLDLPQSISVLPQMVPIREWQQFHHMLKGTNHHSTTTRASRETTQINGVREYIYGDRISRIHWNATAKTGTWKSKEFERESLPKSYLVLDRFAKGYAGEETFELAVSVGASLFQYGSTRDLSFGLVSRGSDDVYFEPRSGQSVYNAAMQHFIDVEADGPVGLKQVLLEKVPQLVPGSFMAIVSPLSGEPMLQILTWLKQQQMNPCHLWIVSDPAAKDSWMLQLKSKGIAGYAIQTLTELPTRLGGRSG